MTLERRNMETLGHGKTGILLLSAGWDCSSSSGVSLVTCHNQIFSRLNGFNKKHNCPHIFTLIAINGNIEQ